MLITKSLHLVTYMNNTFQAFYHKKYRNKGIRRLILENLKNDYNLYVYEKNEGAIHFYTNTILK